MEIDYCLYEVFVVLDFVSGVGVGIACYVWCGDDFVCVEFVCMVIDIW